jgi:dTDP-4-amino-4,6-dideoxygalactose transaminase
MIPYGRQSIDDADIEAVVKVLRSDWLTQGPTVPHFETCVSEYFQSKYAVATNNATSALHIACVALGVGPGDQVWTSAITFAASANCAVYCGATVDFLDIDPLDYNISITALREKLELAKAADRLPKAIVAVHFAGLPCDIFEIWKLKQEYGFFIIEDASHAMGAHYRDQDCTYKPVKEQSKNGKPSRDSVDKIVKAIPIEDLAIGQAKHSDIVVFSLHPVKPITTGEGGLALTNDEGLYKKMKRLRTHGMTTDPEEMSLSAIDEIWSYQQLEIGYNYRMTDIQAALGVSQLTKLAKFTERRSQIAGIYDSELASLPVLIQRRTPGVYSSHHLYPLRILETSNKTRKQLYDHFHELGIRVGVHYSPVYRHPYYRALGFTAGHCPEAESYFRQSLTLPIFPNLTQVQQCYIIEQLKEFLR